MAEMQASVVCLCGALSRNRALSQLTSRRALNTPSGMLGGAFQMESEGLSVFLTLNTDVLAGSSESELSFKLK